LIIVMSSLTPFLGHLLDRVTNFFAPLPEWERNLIGSLAAVAISGAAYQIWKAIRWLMKRRQPQLWVRCRSQIQIPKTVPPEGSVFVLQLSPTPVEKGGGGLHEYTGIPGTQLGSPFESGEPVFSYQCLIANHSGAPIRDAKLSLRVEFCAVIKVDDKGSIASGDMTLDRLWPIFIREIGADPENAFMFYVYNMSDEFVQISVLEKASAILGDKKEHRTLHVVTPGFNKPRWRLKTVGLPFMNLPPFQSAEKTRRNWQRPARRRNTSRSRN
jgi:hypothetical protein